MPVSVNWKKVCHQLVAFLFLATWLGLYQACETVAIAPLPQSTWGDRYAYNYDLPASARVNAPGAVPVTIAVVNPSYKESESALATELYTKVGKGLSLSMGTDLDKILIAKGVTTTGPFPSLDEITYSEKKDATLTLAPRIFITAEIKSDEPRQIPRADRTERNFRMSVTGWVSFIMEEPLSGQKMWIKKLELDSVQRSGIIAVASIPQYGSDGCGGKRLIGYHAGEILYDGRPDAMAGALKEIYPIVLSQFQKYIDTEEMIALKEKTKEIREAKVY